MSDQPSIQHELLLDALLACEAEQRAPWLDQHVDQLSMALLLALKQRSDELGYSDPGAASELTVCGLMLAERCREQPQATALASWARANALVLEDPAAGLEWYERALAIYRATGQRYEVAVLLAIMLAPLNECGRFEQAERAYHEARSLLIDQDNTTMAHQTLEQNYGWLLHNRGDYEGALAAFERALSLAQALERPDIIAEVRINADPRPTASRCRLARMGYGRLWSCAAGRCAGRRPCRRAAG